MGKQSRAEGKFFRKAKNIQEKTVKIFVDIFPDLY